MSYSIHLQVIIEEKNNADRMLRQQDGDTKSQFKKGT